MIFLAYFGSIIMLAAHGVRRQVDSYLKAVSYLVLASVAAGLLIGLTDLYLGTTRSAVFLGVLTGLLACIQHPERMAARRAAAVQGPHPPSRA